MGSGACINTPTRCWEYHTRNVGLWMRLYLLDCSSSDLTQHTYSVRSSPTQRSSLGLSSAKLGSSHEQKRRTEGHLLIGAFQYECYNLTRRVV